MKRKILFGLGGLFIVAVLTSVLVFVIGCDTPEPEEKFAIDGIWAVYKNGDYLIENEFMVFDNGIVYDYRDGNEEPFITSSYAYEDGKLNLSEINKQFSVRIVSDCNVYLIEPNTNEWKLVRVADLGEDIPEFTKEKLQGEYQLLSVAGEAKEEEYLTFTQDKFTDVRNGEQYLESKYEIVDGRYLKVTDLNMEFYAFKYKDTLLLVQKEVGYVWELIEK